MEKDKWAKGQNADKFNRAAENPIPYKRGLDGAGVEREMKKYVKTAKSYTQPREKMQQMTDKFKAAELLRNNNHVHVVINFELGKRAGLHGNMSIDEKIREMNKNDQQARDNAMKEAKRYYRKNMSATKKFNEKAPKIKKTTTQLKKR
jgi:hypothetical protein